MRKVNSASANLNERIIFIIGLLIMAVNTYIIVCRSVSGFSFCKFINSKKERNSRYVFLGYLLLGLQIIFGIKYMVQIIQNGGFQWTELA